MRTYCILLGILMTTYCILFRYINEKRFAGKEQNIMATACIENDVCLILDGTDYRYNLWPITWFVFSNYSKVKMVFFHH